MNVQELIDRLETVEDKTKPVVFLSYEDDGAEVMDEVAHVEPSDGAVLYSDPESVHIYDHVAVLSA